MNILQPMQTLNKITPHSNLMSKTLRKKGDLVSVKIVVTRRVTKLFGENSI